MQKLIEIRVEMIKYDSDMVPYAFTREEADRIAREYIGIKNRIDGPIQDDSQFVYRALVEDDS